MEDWAIIENQVGDLSLEVGVGINYIAGHVRYDTYVLISSRICAVIEEDING